MAGAEQLGLFKQQGGAGLAKDHFENIHRLCFKQQNRLITKAFCQSLSPLRQIILIMIAKQYWHNISLSNLHCTSGYYNLIGMDSMMKSLHLKIIKAEQEYRLGISQEDLQLPLTSIIKRINDTYGYASDVWLYREPFSIFNRLQFIDLSVPLSKVLEKFEQACFTHNNTQFVEQCIPFEYSQPPTRAVDYVYVIIQCKQDTYFHHQTFKLSLDCKMLFLRSMAQRYGKNLYLLYFGFVVPLTLFGKDETIKDALINYCHQPEHIVIAADNNEEQPAFFKTVKDTGVIDWRLFSALGIEGSDRFMVLSKKGNWRTINELIGLIYQADMRIVDLKGYTYRIEDLEDIQQGMFLARKADKKRQLQPKLTNCLFVGSTQHYHCFVQESYLVHLLSSQPPFDLINSAMLHCPPDLHLQEEIPVLRGDTLIMYSITRTAIILKHYQLPTLKLIQTRHFKWYPQLYGQVICSSLDLLAVTLKQRNAIRVFYVNDPNNFMDIECLGQKDCRLWTAKIGLNSHSDGSGYFALYTSNSHELNIYNLKQKRRVDSVFSYDIKHMSFCSKQGFVLIKSQDKWMEYNYEKHQFVWNYLAEANEIMCYSPLGNLLILTEQTVRKVQDSDKIRLGSSLLLQGDTLFSKDEPNSFHNYDSIYDISTNEQCKNSSQNHSLQNSQN